MYQYAKTIERDESEECISRHDNARGGRPACDSGGHGPGDFRLR
ncbi:hypothetical protein [Geomonas azotofigens]|nr:hypothetical protein [Geomonas azotofigens]